MGFLFNLKTSLEKLGIGEKQSQRWQLLTWIPDEQFEQEVAKGQKKEFLIAKKNFYSLGEKCKIKSEREAKYKKKAKAFDKLPSGVEAIKLGRFQDVTKNFADNSIDAIVTDPPYAKEYLKDWLDLARIAKRILKPSGFLVSYSGTNYLDRVMRILGRYLSYYWQSVLLFQPDTHPLFHPKKIFYAYKPVLIYQKEPFKVSKEWICDVVCGTGQEKDLHGWQQAESDLEHLMKGFTEPNDLVLDPFAGTGTFIIQAIKMGRKAKGAEIDDKMIETCKKRGLSIHE